MLAYDYPLLGLFWTIMWWFLWVAWLVVLFQVIRDVFRSHDMGGIAKALWTIFVILVPWLGVLAYLIARGEKMSRRDYDEAKANEAAFRSYVQETAGTSGTADQLSKLAALQAQGVITDAEFADQKAKLLV